MEELTGISPTWHSSPDFRLYFILVDILLNVYNFLQVKESVCPQIRLDLVNWFICLSEMDLCY